MFIKEIAYHPTNSKSVKKMNNDQKCAVCNLQDIVHENHVRNIDGELTRLCPICYKSLD